MVTIKRDLIIRKEFGIHWDSAKAHISQLSTNAEGLTALTVKLDGLIAEFYAYGCEYILSEKLEEIRDTIQEIEELASEIEETATEKDCAILNDMRYELGGFAHEVENWVQVMDALAKV